MFLNSIIFICSILQSQQDTTNYYLKEIDISDSNKFNSNFNHTTINKSYIENSNKQDLSSLLNGLNGISLKDYGGAGGMQLISLRGSNSNQIAYILDGFKINDKSTGSFNSSLFNLNNISSISIQNTGNSSKYGSNALFGAININSTIPQLYNVDISLASFDNYRFNSSLPINNTFSVDLFAQSNKANYPIDFNNQKVKRNNSELERYDVSLNKIFLQDNGYHKIKYLINYQNQGVPGAVVQNRLENTSANLNTINNYLFYSNYYDFNSYKIKSGFYYNYSELNYKDTLNKITNSNGINNNFYTNNIQTYFEIKKEFNSSYIEARLDNDFTNLVSDAFFKEQTGNIFGISLSYFYNLNNFILFLSSRYDVISYTKNNISNSVYFNYKLNKYESTLSFSRNFRAPCFNEMYYLNFGNNDLLPEISNSIDFNNKFNLFNFIFNINPYYSIINDYIISIPISPVVWSAQNLEKVNNYGIENSIEYNINNLKLIFNYTYQKSIFIGERVLNNTNLPYLPNELISFFINYNSEYINIFFDAVYNSFRYYNQGDDNNSVIDPFTLLNINFNKEIDLFANSLLLNFSINNLLNINYQYIINYPMPGINFNLSLNYRFK